MSPNYLSSYIDGVSMMATIQFCPAAIGEGLDLDVSIPELDPNTSLARFDALLLAITA
jgi:hypothetical protein